MSAKSDAVSFQIDQMKAELGVSLDRELASRLGIDPSAIAAWRRRGVVPGKYVIRHRRSSDERVASGQIGGKPSLSPGRLREGYVFSLIDYVARKPIDYELSILPSAWLSIWRGFRLANAYSYFLDAMPNSTDKDELRAGYEKILTEIDEGDFLMWLETL